MARKFYGVDNAAGHDHTSIVTEGASSTGKHVEFSIDDAVSLTKEEVYACAMRLASFIVFDQTITGEVSDYRL